MRACDQARVFSIQAAKASAKLLKNFFVSSFLSEPSSANTVSYTHLDVYKRQETVRVGNEDVEVREEIVSSTAFGALLRFRKNIDTPQPRVLVVAPMSGHFATLLRNTVKTLLSDHDVYITDWLNARDAPLAAGRFGFDEYVEHVMTLSLIHI